MRKQLHWLGNFLLLLWFVSAVAIFVPPKLEPPLFFAVTYLVSGLGAFPVLLSSERDASKKAQKYVLWVSGVVFTFILVSLVVAFTIYLL